MPTDPRSTGRAGPLGYADDSTPWPQRSRRLPGWVVWATWAAVIASMGVAGVLSANRSHSHDPRAKCASNLRQIAMACIIYASEHGGPYPDTAGTARAESDLTAEVFTCWATNDVRAAGPSTQQFKQQIDASGPPGSGGVCSYVYVGAGLTDPMPPAVAVKTVVAYEPASNHGGTGGNVVYADAHVEWQPAAKLNRIAAAVRAGRNPPP
ncbi:MAG: hypothetical protein JWO31_4184 [Phycisphaerales bacterium]|nr:hypothetical protein [Phycisphaerales bacterium]